MAVKLVNDKHGGVADRRHPNIIKKEMRAARRSLKAAEKKLHDALAVLEKAKRAKSLISIIAEKERAYLEADRKVTGLQGDIKDLEKELMGEWAPEGWGGGDAA